MQDCVQLDRDLRRQKRQGGPDVFKWLTYAVVLGASLYMFYRQACLSESDIAKHAIIASEFVFTDLHSITSRLAYPLWHLFVSALYQLGMPLAWAAALMCALCKLGVMALTHRILTVTLRERLSRVTIALTTLCLMIVTGVYAPFVNEYIYRGVGSPNVWHNPTQQACLLTALLCVPYLMHCWCEFERRLPAEGERACLPWSKVAVLAVLLMLNLACKPTFMQALIPAAALLFLVEWIRHPKNSRFFWQLIAAFVPAVAYFLLQYLYYTGVVVEYTSGVSIGVTLESALGAIRNMLLMALFPLYAILCCYRKGMMKDRSLVLALLMVLFSVLEAMCFRETGVRTGHGNFNWASMSSAFFLWLAMLPRFAVSFKDYRSSEGKTVLRTVGYGVGFALLAWQVFSGVYYYVWLLQSGSTF